MDQCHDLLLIHIIYVFEKTIFVDSQNTFTPSTYVTLFHVIRICRTIIWRGILFEERGKIIQWPRNRPNWWESRPRWLLRDTYLHAPLEITVESNGRFRESRNGPQWGKTVVLSDTPICRISRNYHDSEI